MLCCTDLHCVLEDVFWCDVNLCDDKEDGYLEGQGHTQVLLAHTHDTHVGTNYQARVVGQVARQAVGGGAEVLLMT